MKIGDEIEGYSVIQICTIKEWCVCLMQSMDDNEIYGVLDYSFETDSVYDFVQNMAEKSALILFIRRMPITLDE